MSGIKIPVWSDYKEQECRLGLSIWSVPRLIELSRDLERFRVPLKHLNIYYVYDKLTLRDMVMHMQAVHSADLRVPIILDEDGELMDGRHRIMKAIMFAKTDILAVRFDVNPRPCRKAEEDT